MNKFCLFVFTCFCSFNVFGQLVGNCNAPFDTPEGLVEILVGEGVEFSNVTFSGFDCSAGFFNGPSNIGFESGLVMATNGLEGITPGGFGGGFGGPGVDEDLTEQLEIVNASATNLNNLIVIEFDFIPTSDVVTFEYVFASNEYPGYTCSQFNDIFGFFLSGPGITGGFEDNAINIALVPNPDDPTTYTNTPVIINTINSGAPSFGDSAPCDNIDPNWQDYSIFFTDNNTSETVSYPGFTVPLVATANVTACLTYHIKLAIADVADGALNSAVFLKENSFNSPPPIEFVVESNTVNIFNSDSEYIDNLYEGCGEASIIFERPEAIEGDIVFDFQTSGEATDLVDFYLTNALNNQIVMLDGESSVSLDILATYDELNEGYEELIIEILPVDYGCYETDPDTVIFQLHDQPPITVEALGDNLLDCPGDEAYLYANVSGGVGSLLGSENINEPYTYLWSNLGSDQEYFVYPQESSTYYLQVTDICGQQANDLVDIEVQTYDPLIASSDTVYICEDIEDQICVDVVGGNEGYNYLWSNGDTTDCIFDFHGEYFVVVTDNCEIDTFTVGQIYLDEAPDPVFSVNQMPDENLGVDINNSTFALDGLSYFWDFGDNTGSIVEDPEYHYYPESGEYTVTLGVTTEINNCYKEISQVVQVAPLYYYYAPNSFTPNGDMMNDTFSPSIVGIETYELFIFDRWGKQVFYSNDFNNKWDGTFESTDAQNGTYNFKVLIKKYYDDTIYQEYGMVTLLR